jgi:organic radical activating enzyme
MLKVNNIFSSIQGEGALTGIPCTFVRLHGCNLSCPFCDTTNISYVLMENKEIVKRCKQYKNSHVVFTGGEPLMQLTREDVLFFSEYFFLCVETNGTIALPEKFDHVSLSPKVSRDKCLIREFDSLKILYPYYNDVTASQWLEDPCDHKSLQVISPEIATPAMWQAAIREVQILKNKWRVGVQIHKFMKGVE